MPLFNETLESIAQAIVTIKRALKAGVIDKENYKELETYLAKRAVDFKMKKSHIAKAKRDLKDELKSEVEELFMDEGDALYRMAEELLEEFNEDEETDVCKTWANMTNKERAAMAVLASKWEKSR
jgi:predicted transcriptional regulator